MEFLHEVKLGEGQLCCPLFISRVSSICSLMSCMHFATCSMSSRDQLIIHSWPSSWSTCYLSLAPQLLISAVSHVFFTGISEYYRCTLSRSSILIGAVALCHLATFRRHSGTKDCMKWLGVDKMILQNRVNKRLLRSQPCIYYYMSDSLLGKWNYFLQFLSVF